MHADDPETIERLDRISTHWTLVFEAHESEEPDALAARRSVLLRYRNAIFRYAFALMKDLDAAEELSQEFAVRILSGDFHRADPERGRFRDYLKTSLLNAARKTRREESKLPERLPSDVTDAGARNEGNNGQPSFAELWRDETLNQTWEALRQQRPVYHDLLRLRVDHPEMTSREIARRYEQTHPRAMTAANVRKTISRAQAKFADLLVREVASILETSDKVDICNELVELDLLKYCRSAIEKWRSS